MITPTVGRVVWYFDHNGKGPMAAIIASVKTDGVLNLGVFAEDGTTFPVTDVTLVQEDSEIPASDYCKWMPYQVGQAQKTEQLQKELDSKDVVA